MSQLESDGSLDSIIATLTNVPVGRNLPVNYNFQYRYLNDLNVPKMRNYRFSGDSFRIKGPRMTARFYFEIKAKENFGLN